MNVCPYTRQRYCTVCGLVRSHWAGCPLAFSHTQDPGAPQ